MGKRRRLASAFFIGVGVLRDSDLIFLKKMEKNGIFRAKKPKIGRLFAYIKSEGTFSRRGAAEKKQNILKNFIVFSHELRSRGVYI
jgi:hypothetical protein